MIKYSEATGLYYEIKGEGAGSYAVITDAEKKQSTFDVPGLIEGVPVREIGKKAFLGCKALREVTLPASVEKLGEWAFAFCDNLTVVRMARMKTELGKGIFKNDRKLKDIIVYDEEMKPGTVSRLLAAAPIYMDAEYLLDTQHAGTDEWYKDLYTNFHSSFICDSHKLKITRMFVSRRMGQQNVVYPYSGILLSNKKE